MPVISTPFRFDGQTDEQKIGITYNELDAYLFGERYLIPQNKPYCVCIIEANTSAREPNIMYIEKRILRSKMG